METLATQLLGEEVSVQTFAEQVATLLRAGGGNGDQKYAERIQFKATGRQIHLLNTRSSAFTGGVVIATAHLAKGLEFDQVLVPHGSEANYHTLIDRHMLYVACTRAMHRLHLTHTGQPSPFLREAGTQ